MRAGSLRFALIFPPDAESSESFGLKVKFLNNPRNEIETQMTRGLIEKAIFTSAPQAFLASLQKRANQLIGQAKLEQFNRALADSVAQAFGGDPAQLYDQISRGQIVSSSGSAGDSKLLERLIRIDSEEVGGGKVKSPMATRSVGGWAVMFLLFSLSSSATSLFDERKAGLYQRLLSAPVKRTQILWSKYLFGMLVGLIQLSALFFAGHLLFGIDLQVEFRKPRAHLPRRLLGLRRLRDVPRRDRADLRGGERHGHVPYPHHERDRRRLVSRPA